MADQGRRHFLRGLLREGARTLAAFQDGREEARRALEHDAFFDSYESSYALTLAYPDDILIETAQRNGIPTEVREKKDIVKELFDKHGGYNR